MSLPASVPRILELANTIKDSVERLQSTLASTGHPLPSLAADYRQLPENVLANRDAVLDAAIELYDTLLDPLSLIFQFGGHNNMISLQAISRFNIASHVSSEGSISYDDLAQTTGVSKILLQRVLRHAIARHIFCEPEPGLVQHTTASKALLRPFMDDWLTVATEEMWTPATKFLDAYNRWPDSEEPSESAFSLANGTQEPAYQIIGKDMTRASHFSGAMQAYTSGPDFDVSHILDNYDWASLGAAQVVDIGGAQGHIAIALAQRFEDLHILVQDMGMIIEGAEHNVPAELKERVRFEAHDLFAPQTATADVIYLRWILHNWSDKYCVMILRALIPSLKPGSRLLIQDTLMPDPGKAPKWRVIELRSADLNMGAAFNSRERTAEEWRTLIKEADARFELTSITSPKSSTLSLFDVRWNAEV